MQGVANRFTLHPHNQALLCLTIQPEATCARQSDRQGPCSSMRSSAIKCVGYLCSAVESLVPDNQVGKVLARARALHEGVSQELLRCLPLLGIGGEAFPVKVHHDLAVPVLPLELWHSLCGNQVEGPKRLLLQIGRLSLHHFNHHDPQTPNVDRLVIALTPHKLRSHPIGSSHHRVAKILLLRQLHAEAKVCNLDGSLGVDQDVVTLDVSVDPSHAVEVSDCL
mmetsp:Transcript_8082/g.19752  ORF Transcript_8082/g.19752 Transcript_8082/m.19752 type:complete len:223 (-) Transcript_8082:627-1295(-)